MLNHLFSLCLNTDETTVHPACTFGGSRKPVKTVLSGPRKHTERFGCNSHIGQLNATTSALFLPFAYSIHMLMMSLVFIFFLHVCMCMCVCVCYLFLSLFFFCTSSPPPNLFVLPNKKMLKIWIHTSLFGRKIIIIIINKKQIGPSYFHFLLPND